MLPDVLDPTEVVLEREEGRAKGSAQLLSVLPPVARGDEASGVGVVQLECD